VQRPLVVERGHAARQHGKRADLAIELAERGAQPHRGTRRRAFGFGAIRPQPEPLLRDEQGGMRVVDAAQFDRGRQRQAAYHPVAAVQQPLLRLAILADDEYVVEVLDIAVHAGGLDAEAGFRQGRQRGQCALPQVDAHRLHALGVGIDHHGQRAALAQAQVELLGAHGQAGALAAIGADQAQGVLVQGQPGAAGQRGQLFGIGHEGRYGRGSEGGRRGQRRRGCRRGRHASVHCCQQSKEKRFFHQKMLAFRPIL
jgi:hypothetical protein